MGGSEVGRGGTRRNRRVGRCVLFAGLCASWSAVAGAEEQSATTLLGLETHGFASQGFIYTTDNQFLAKSQNGSVEFSEIGLNFTQALTDKFRFGAQLFAGKLGPLGDYTPTFDWYYLDYRFFSWLGVRAGRTKVPFGLYRETSDIDAARASVLLPQSVYPARNLAYLLSQTGADIYGYLPLGVAGALDYRLFGGTPHYEPPAPAAGVEYSIPYVIGGRLQWLTPLEGLSAGFSAVTLRVDQNVTFPAATVAALIMAGALPADSSGKVNLRSPLRSWIASLEYSLYDLLLGVEYARSRAEFSNSEPSLNPVLFPPTGEPPYPVRGEAYYAMAAYRVTPWFTPGAYYAVSHPNLDNEGGRESYQKDLALFIRFDLNQYWLLKLEGHYMNGTAGLEPTLNGLSTDAPLSSLTRIWGAFLAKTTAYF